MRRQVRRVLDAEVKNGTLLLAAQRLGQTPPTKLEICRERDRRVARNEEKPTGSRRQPGFSLSDGGPVAGWFLWGMVWDSPRPSVAVAR
jgi:hypothetical protein